MQMILPIVAGVLILAAFVALFLSRDTWRVYHIIIAFFLLVANVVFFYLAARTLDTHRAWRSQVSKYEEMYAQLEQETRKLTGELDGRGEVIVDRHDKAEQGVPWSIDDWENELAEAGYGRGRVLTTGLAKEDPASGNVMANVSEGVTLPKDALVYVFQSQPQQQPGRPIKYPGTETGEVTITSPPIVGYLGAYVVLTAGNGPKLELAPLHPERRTGVNGPLVIFELAPVDTHKAFAHLKDKDNVKDNFAPLKKLFLPSVPAEVVDRYVKDGQPVPPPKDPNEIVENVWRRVRFVKAHTLKDPEFKAPAAPPAAPPPAPAGDEVAADPAADEAGAPDPLASGGLRFQPDDEALFDPHTAADLVMKGIAQYVASNEEEKVYSHVYVRPLNDYPQAFRNVRNELIATELAIAELDRQIKAIQDSIKLAQDTERIRKEEAAKRTADLKNLTVEVATMQKLHDDWAQTAKAANDKVESLKQSIGSLAEELTRLQRQAAQATGQRAALR
jgi:hypothetical protein